MVSIRPCAAWACTLLVALAAPVWPQTERKTGQSVDGDVLIDHDYAFRIRKAGEEWTLLGEEESSRVVPESIAGMRRTDGGVWGALIAERGLDLTPSEYADLILGDVVLEDMQILEREQLIVLGNRAERVFFEGRIESTKARYVSTFLMRKGFAYQVISWTMNDQTTKAQLLTLHQAISFLPDAPRERAESAERLTLNADGIGWIVRNGVFRSAVYGFQVEPPAGWRVVVGDELAQMNPDATVGLTNRAGKAHAVIIPEVMRDVDQDATVARLLETVSEEMTGGPAREIELQVGGEARTLALHQTDEPFEAEFIHGAWFHGDILTQVLAWYPLSARDDARVEVAAALLGLSRLTDDQLAEVHRELEVQQAVQSRITAIESLRAGHYRNYAQGIEWQLPREGYWSVEIGGAVRQKMGPDWLVAFDEPSTGLSGAMRVEVMEDTTPEQYHQISVDLLASALGVEQGHLPEPIAFASGFGEGWVTHLPAWLDDPAGSTASVATWLRGTTGIEVQFYGSEPNLRAATPVMTAAAQGLRPLPDHVQSLRFDGSVAESHLFGFSIDAPKGFGEPRVMTPKQIEGLGLLLASEGKRGYLGAIAVSLGGDWVTQNDFFDLVWPIAEAYAPDVQDPKQNCHTSQLGGRAARACTYPTAEGQFGLFLATRGRTGYALFVQARSAEGLQRVREGFELLD